MTHSNPADKSDTEGVLGLPTTCPKCGKVDVLDAFDVGGADRDNVFCTRCHCEFNPATGTVAPPNAWCG